MNITQHLLYMSHLTWAVHDDIMTFSSLLALYEGKVLLLMSSPLQRDNNANIWYMLVVEQTVELPLIWDTMALTWCHFDEPK